MHQIHGFAAIAQIRVYGHAQTGRKQASGSHCQRNTCRVGFFPGVRGIHKKSFRKKYASKAKPKILGGPNHVKTFRLNTP
jgi:hypothetical protein